jgi:hypothetical protein
MVDPFALPADASTDGWEYQWRRIPELGDPNDVEHWYTLLEAGFRPFLVDNKPLDVQGMRLMRRESSAALTARLDEYTHAIAARDQRLHRLIEQLNERDLTLTCTASFDGGLVQITAGHGEHQHLAVVQRSEEGGVVPALPAETD